MKKVALIILIALVVIISAIFLFNRQNKASLVGNETTCVVDNDCVIVPQRESKELCCNNCNSEVINKKAQEERGSWWAKNCTEIQCPVYDCYDGKLPTPRCIGNQCVIEWKERT